MVWAPVREPEIPRGKHRMSGPPRVSALRTRVRIRVWLHPHPLPDPEQVKKLGRLADEKSVRGEGIRQPPLQLPLYWSGE